VVAASSVGRSGRRGPVWRYAWHPGQEWDVGFNPFRQQKRRSSDYVLVAAAVAITLLLVLWALIPR
jgi:hypothetical protein